MNRQDNSNSLTGVTWRVIVFGLLLIIPQAYFSLWGFVWWQSHPATVSLYFNVVTTLLIVSVINLAVRRFFPSFALSRAELVMIYGMLSVATALYGHDQLHNIVPVVAYPQWHATAENGWQELFIHDIPSWLTVKNPDALRAYFDSRQPIYTSAHWRPWVVPALAWTGFMSVMTFVFLCINTLVRRQWTEESRLSYPIVQLPLELTSSEFTLFKSKLFWIGVAIAVIFDTVNGLHTLYPTFPGIMVEYRSQYNLEQYVSGMPWGAIGWTPLAIFPFAVGLTFFVPLDLAFSMWFFYIFWKIVRIGVASAGLYQYQGAPWVKEQNFAGYIVLALASLWTTRRHLLNAVRGAFGIGDVEDDREPMPYSWAVWGAVIGIIALLLFCARAGASVWSIGAWLGVYLLISVGVTRIRAELGSPVHDLHFIGPHVALTEIAGVKTWGKDSLIMFSFFFAFTRANRSHPMPTQIETMKMGAETNTSQRAIAGTLMLAAVVGLLIGWFVILDGFFRAGGQPAYPGRGAWSQLDSWLNNPTDTRWPAVIAMVIGGVFTLVLHLVRSRYAWFPFHPTGFAVSGTWSMALFAPSVLVSWLFKAVILRYGGMRAYRPASYLFMGLIVGEFFMGAFWGTYGIIMKKPMYNFLP